MENTVVCGGDGCPGVAEFAPAELGAALGQSTTAATSLIRDALGLRHRLPRTWARVLAGQVPAWRARRVAHASHKLSAAAAGLVDARVHRIAEKLTTYRLDRIVEAAVLDADPDLAQAEADAAAADRGVWVAQADLHGTKTLVVKAAAGDVIRFEARTDQIADALAALGDTDTKDLRRAKAIGWLADPQAAFNLLTTTHTAAARAATTATLARRNATAPTSITTEAGIESGTAVAGVAGGAGAAAGTGVEVGPAADGGFRRSVGPAHTLYVHLTDETLRSGTGVIRASGQTRGQTSDCGPLLASQLSELLGHDRIVVKPVIDLRDQIAVDAYEIPDRVRERVLLRHTHCIFPWCNRPATRRTDLDHIVAYDDTGPPGQTSTENLAPLCRLHHRLKTHSGWRYRRLPDGAFEWTSPRDRVYRVDPTGTQRLPPPAAAA